MGIRTHLVVASALLAAATAASAQQPANMRFRGMDRDGDGVITRGEWRGSDRSFREQDWNGDGVLSGDEVNPAARRPERQNPQDSRLPPFNEWTPARFASLDRNRDGVVSRDEWPFDAQSFQRGDHNGDNHITRDEFLATGVDSNRAGGDRFTSLDTNRDGRVDRNEWRGTIQTFNALDRNGDGALTREEIAARGDDPTTDLFASLDTNRDRRISQNEWHWSLDSFRSHDTNHDGWLSRAELNNGPVGTSGRAVETPAYRAGYERGMTEGRQAGREDKSAGHWDLEGQRELERADSGYAANVGPLNEYQNGYRSGFRTGYSQGYGPR